MASKSENSEIAVLQTQMTGVQADVTEMKGDIKEVKTLLTTDHFVTQEQFRNFKNNWWLSHTLTAIITGGMIFLIQYAITHR